MNALTTRLIDDWRKAYKFSSVQIATGAGAITSAWQIVPNDVKDRLPPWLTTAFALAAFVAIILARVTKKPEVPDA